MLIFRLSCLCLFFTLFYTSKILKCEHLLKFDYISTIFRPSFDATPTYLRLARFRVCSYFCIGFLNHRLTLLLYNMKLDSINGKGSGKSGSKVYYVNRGVQCEREYTSEVHNPNTPAQVDQRSRFKLASQVSAAMAPVIAIPRKGILSPRNRFVKRNMSFFYANGQGADVQVEGLQITLGYVPCPSINIERLGNILKVSLYTEPSKDIARVVYCVFLRGNDGKISFMGSTISTYREGREFFFDATLPKVDGNIIVYAYGMRDNSAKATAKYESYKIQSGVDIARLVASRKINFVDYSFTATNSNTLAANENTTTEPSAGEVQITVWSNNGATLSVVVNGGNPILSANDVVTAAVGATVVITAPAVSGWAFEGFFINGEQTPIQTNSELTFTALENRSIVARYRYGEGLE